MKKTSMFMLCALCSVLCVADANAGYDDKQFRKEIADGLDMYVARDTAYTADDAPIGELGADVYTSRNTGGTADDVGMYIPNDMYIRGGGGINLSFASDKAKIYGDDFSLSSTYSAQLGLGWNMSSYVRTEIDFQAQSFGFSDHSKLSASTQQLGGTLYFDFARRYVRSGDITKRRTFVPFMGLGVGIGMYEFEGYQGADGMFVAPRGILGFNVMLTDLIGIDVAYQYQMFIGDGFGWDTNNSVQNLSDVMVTFRFNF